MIETSLEVTTILRHKEPPRERPFGTKYSRAYGTLPGLYTPGYHVSADDTLMPSIVQGEVGNN